VWALALALAAVSCGGVRTDGFGHGGVSPAPADARPADTRPGDAGTSSAPLPGAGGKSAAVWTCSGGGNVGFEGAPQVGLSIGGISGAAAVSAPGGSRITLGHFADTVEAE
jgi:hypothetical protein